MLFARYSFSVYDIAARRCGAVPVVASDADYGTDVDALLAAVTERTRVVFVANPNNPTGSFLPHAEIARLHAGLPADVVLVVDQAYAEYLAPADDDGALALAAIHANVLVRVPALVQHMQPRTRHLDKAALRRQRELHTAHAAPGEQHQTRRHGRDKQQDNEQQLHIPTSLASKRQ